MDGWNGIAQPTCLKYVASMRSRCQAVIQANGGHNRYLVKGIVCCVIYLKFYTGIDVILRSAVYRIAINYESVSNTMVISICQYL